MAENYPSGDGPPSAAEEGLGWALEQALGRQSEVGVLILDAGLRVCRGSLDAPHFHGLTVQPGGYFPDLVVPDEAEDIAVGLRRAIDSDTPLLFRNLRIRHTATVVTLFALPIDSGPHSDGGRVLLGIVDSTSDARARQRLDLLLRGAEAIGESVDVLTTARQLVDVFVPALADLASVSLADEVFTGSEPPSQTAKTTAVRRAAVRSTGLDWSPPYVQPGEKVPPIPGMPAEEDYRAGEVIHLPDPDAVRDMLDGDDDLARRLVPAGAHALLAVELVARGMILGSLEIWRAKSAAPFDENDARLLRLVASRGALSIDNARRFTRERTEALRLQQSLLSPPSQSGTVQSAARYLAASVGGGVGGDWYDVIPLSSTRTGLVVGDVVGHGVSAAAMMGRMRTAVQTLADLDLGPDELLAHLDDLVSRLAEDNEIGALGSTCLFAVYDPVRGYCAMASAGHPPPMLVRPDGRAERIPLTAGPPLGVGGLPFEVIELTLEPGSTLAFYTDGLVNTDAPDIDAGMEHLRLLLTGLDVDAGLEETADHLVAALLPASGRGPAALDDDATLLLTRVRATAAENTATWEFPARESAVSEARERATSQLASWEAPMETALTVELVVSELVTNAVRYGAGNSLELRLIRDGSTLICEVSDASSTSPHLKRARSDDEGGRGLFIVAQMSERWGVRFTRTGKTIWTRIRT
jgi:serine phosphatase RsbU (regulator of sigma subunit)/anti-sigma regulatory factor (Ser/Thr protein kinase)